MPTANEVLLDVSLRHAVDVRRFTAGETKKVLRLLERADVDLVRQLRTRLATLPVPVDFRSRRLVSMLADVEKARDTVMARVQGTLDEDLARFSTIEAEAERAGLQAAVPIETRFASASLAQLRAVVTEQPFQGRNLGAWHKSLASADKLRLRDAIQLGYSQGESVPSIVQRVAGTRAQRFADGALSITRRNAETVVRTAVNHVSNAARDTVFEANSDIISGKRWVSTLDGRTTPICRARDGKVASVGGKPLPKGSAPLVPSSATPPAHPSCRSLMIAIFDGDGLVGERPFVRTTKRYGAREVDFRKMAKDQGRTVSAVRKDWTAANVGTVPAKTTYEQWIRRQPAAFQDEALGKTKGALFRRGGLKLDQYVDRVGNELNLEQLAGRHPEAFLEANIDPKRFMS